MCFMVHKVVIDVPKKMKLERNASTNMNRKKEKLDKTFIILHCLTKTMLHGGFITGPVVTGSDLVFNYTA